MTDVAIAHDYLTQRGGAERVVLALHRTFPRAPIHTSLYEPTDTYPELGSAQVHTAPINRVGVLRRHHRLALPVLAPTFSTMRVDAEVLICSSTGWAHGTRTTGRKIVYCHAPARWLYQRDEYVAHSGRATVAALRVLEPALRRWDRAAARSADRYVVNSNRTRGLVRDAYGIDATVIHPPHGVDPSGAQTPVRSVDPGFFLCVSRLLAYKHIDAVIEAFADLRDERLVVVGSGPDRAALEALAAPNVTFLTDVTDDHLRWLYAHSRALVAASIEDFGLTPVEAAAFGTPSIVLRFGGYLDSVVEGATGAFFDQPTAPAIAAAVRQFPEDSFDADHITAHATRFSEASFAAAMRDLVSETAP